MNAYDVNSNKHILTLLLEKALLNIVLETDRQCVSKPQEPDYVAMLSTRFTKRFFDILTAVFPDYNFSVTGVYCHQKPIVDINLDRKPELGDILLVYADQDIRGERTVNSLLLQVKISIQSQLTVHWNEKHQLELYKKWPEFTYHRAGYLNGEKRDILPKAINDGAQYLLIDTNPETNGLYGLREAFPMGCAVPDDVLYVNDSLSNELINLLKFKAGRTVDNDPYRTKDGWSKMIWDLLRLAAANVSRRKNAQLDSFSRKSKYNHYSSGKVGGRSLLDEALGDFAQRGTLHDNDEGVSLILIESWPGEKQAEWY